ncbi:alanine racemase [candidate division KSB1 bacterium]|nr:alanine racemase [candidate division KSB1 bacterium]
MISSGSLDLHPVARIDLDALRINTQLLLERVSPRGLLAVVKWNGYGHGLVPCARVLAAAGVTAFGVSSPDEGVELRKAGIPQPILVMTDWVGKPVKLFLDYNLEAAATSWYKVEYLAAVARNRGMRIPTHVKFDTGLGRVGIPEHDADWALPRIAAMRELNVCAIYSHLGYSGPQDERKGRAQIAVFNRIVARAAKLGIQPRWIHLANSAAALAIPDVPGNLVRTGIALYGQPTTSEVSDALPLQPVMTLAGRIRRVQRVKRGHGFPTALIWRAPADGWGAEVALGFGVSYPRSFAGQAPVLFRGKRVPLVGVMGRDASFVFCGTGKPEVGEEVVFWGKQGDSTLYLYELAPLIGALAYELPTWLSPRLERQFIAHSNFS